MKRTIFVLLTTLVVFVIVLAVLVVHPVRTVKARHGCSNATLKGNYALVAPGAQYVNVQRGFSMLATFNGEEDFSGSNFNITSGGIPYPTPPTAPYSFSGSTYTVNPDCTCTLTEMKALAVARGTRPCRMRVPPTILSIPVLVLAGRAVPMRSFRPAHSLPLFPVLPPQLYKASSSMQMAVK